MDKRKLRSKYINDIKALEFPKLDMRNFYVTNAVNGKYYKTRCVDDLTFDLEIYSRGFNEEVLKQIRKYPDKFMNDTKYGDLIEEKVTEITNRLPQDFELIESYWDRYFKAVDICFNYITNKLKGE